MTLLKQLGFIFILTTSAYCHAQSPLAALPLLGDLFDGGLSGMTKLESLPVLGSLGGDLAILDVGGLAARETLPTDLLLGNPLFSDAIANGLPVVGALVSNPMAQPFVAAFGDLLLGLRPGDILILPVQLAPPGL